MALTVTIPKCDSAINQTLVPTAAYTASDTAGPFPVDFFSSAEITVAVTSCSGSLDVYCQKLLADDTTYDDIEHFAQWTTGTFTTTGTYVLSFVNGGNTINQQKAAGLAVNTVNTVHFGSKWRIKYVIAGASATVTFGVFGNFRA